MICKFRVRDQLRCCLMEAQSGCFVFSRCAEAGALLLVPVDLIIRLVSWTQFEHVGQLGVGGDSGASMLRVVFPPPLVVVGSLKQY